eukprot:Tamp_12185.p1 GENE.Tamp_12185~~Tamp_12185.p1  ORF type:complete len:435 (+),score=103.53 Tamp_12185:251-1555(+)
MGVDGPPAAVEVQAAVQNYEWGVRGGADHGLVARMAKAPHAEGTPFAELWMGTHPKAPLTVVDAGGFAAPGTTLSQFLQANPTFAGAKAVQVYGDQLPYLFKCLSVAKALSIQAHPNKTLAQQLHARDPKNYPDDNHKPEMAVAVTDFEGLCGFRPLAQLALHLASCPELRALATEANAGKVEAAVSLDAAAQSEALKAAFSAVMSSDPALITAQAESMVARLQAKEAATRTDTEALILRINEQFPGDVGLFNIMFLNHCVLQPGQALFLGANLPHAYISGDCMEIMATSDNVVRAGFTPKFKDVNTLVDMLQYTCGDTPVMNGDMEEGGLVSLYQPPGADVPEFALRRVALAAGSSASLGTSAAPRTVICVSGGGGGALTLAAESSALAATTRHLQQSSVVVVGAGATLTVSLDQGADQGALLFVASCHSCFE